MVFLLLACSGPSILGNRAAAPTPVVVRFEVGGEAMPVDDAPPDNRLELPLIPVVAASPPAASPTPTLPPPAPTSPPASPAGPPEPVPAVPPPVATPDPTVPAAAPDPPLPPSPTEAVSYALHTGETTDQIRLIDPAPGFVLPPDQNRLEFKWAWSGPEARPCQLREGFGFEIRIWPDLDPAANPHLSAAARQAIQPLGAVDAVAEQEKIRASCNPEDNTYRYTVADLQETPGVRQGGGYGHFFWEAVYIQAQPYYAPLRVSAPRDFFIPAPATVTAALTPTATPPPPFPLTPPPKPAGTITLLAPEANHTFPANVGPVEFSWLWAGENQAGPCHLAEGYGFELRIWSKRPDFTPLGVMDVVAHQDRIGCDPMTGRRSVRVADLKQAAGVKATYTGEFRWDGQFWWDVALVSLRPYTPPDSASSPHGFEISVQEYTGPLDPFGETLKCSDFPAWPEAQAVFLAAGGPVEDRHALDTDGNGLACDTLRQ